MSRKDNIMDRHDRGTTHNLESHVLTMTSHNAGGGGASVFRIVNDDNIFGPSDAGNDSISAGGHFNFAVISGAGVSLANADDNNLLGRGAGRNATSLNDSNALGPLAGENWTGARNMNALGPNAAQGDAGGCTAADVNASGKDTGKSLTSGHDLNLFGQGAGADLTNATHVNLMGRGAGANMVGPDHVNASGNNVLFSSISGSNHNVFGQTGFWRAVSGSHLNGVGNNVGAACTGNSSNILCLGSSAGPSTQAEYNQQVFIDNHASDTPLFHMDTDAHIVTINGRLVTTGAATAGGATDVNTAAYAIDADDTNLSVGSGVGAVTITLASAEVINGREITITDADNNAGTNNITIQTEGGEFIQWQADFSLLADAESITLYSDGTNWFVK